MLMASGWGRNAVCRQPATHERGANVIDECEWVV